MGISWSGELPLVFEMSQALMVMLVEYSRKVGDLISIKLFGVFLTESRANWLQADAFPVGFCHRMWSTVLLPNVKQKGGELFWSQVLLL